MRVMFSIDGYTAHYYIRLGVAKVLKLMGHDVILWDINKKSVFDAFDEYEPDLFIGQTFNVNKALIKCLEERPHVRVIMKASDYGPAMEEMDLNKFPVLVARQDELDLMKEMKEKTGKPDFVLIHYHKDYVDHTHGYWANLGINYQSILSASDIIDYTNGENREEYSTDVCFVGGYWPYKSKTLDDYILKLCQPGKNVRIKIFGNQNWPVPQYCGSIDNDDVKHVLKSALICPNIHELHSQVYGWDIVERPYKLLSNKCFVISDYVEGLVKLYDNNEIVFAKDPGEFEDKVMHFIKSPEERLPYIERGFNRTIKEHTYFDRVAQIMDLLGLPTQKDLAFVAKKETLRRLGIGEPV